MNSTGSVRSDASLRLFCALRLSADVLDGLVEWGARALPEREGVRRVDRANLHVTLAFLGRRPADEVGAIARELREAAAAPRPARFAVSRYRETRSVGMLVLDDEEGRATALADDLHERLQRLGAYERERRPWLPHLTVVRFRERPRLARAGADYEVIESVQLGQVGG